MEIVRPKKNLGQHFLTNLSIAKRITDTIDTCPNIPILEMDPGMDVLTQCLVEKPREVKTVEIDRGSVAYLRENFPKLRGNIVGQDFLHMDLHQVFDGQQFALTDNYPYDISSQIFFKMLDYKDFVPYYTGMIRHEAAQRIASKPDSKACDILSVLMQAQHHMEYLFTVDERVFNPLPEAKSAVIRTAQNEMHDLGCDEIFFKRVVRTVFNQRRKVLRVSLRQLFPDEGASAEFYAGELMTRRPEQLSVMQLVTLTSQAEVELERLHQQGSCRAKEPSNKDKT